jgi:DNA-binding LacI/PurR family transcriptional regulator
MKIWQKPTAETLLAAHLRGELERGRWSGKMPGVILLARELGAARTTVERALRELEREGLLAAQGQGYGRVIVEADAAKRRAGLRIRFLAYEASDRGTPYLIDMQTQLEAAGHVADFAQKTLLDMRRDVGRVAAMVEESEADAWAVVSGPQEVLEWFAARRVPAFALFGRRRGVPIAGGGPDKVPAMRTMVRSLCELGHRRIVLLVRSERRKPQPGGKERAFLEELAAHGIDTGAYHLPEWEETPEGFLDALERLFASTPPTALILDEGFLFVSARQHLAQAGILTPRDVSLVCCDLPDATLAWMRPGAAHIRWDHRPLVRRIVRWADHVSQGRKDLRQTDIQAEFVEGGTIGRAR